MNNQDRFVPVQTLRQAIYKGISASDPKGSKAKMYYSTMYRNEKKYNLEVLYNSADNTIYHFKYQTGQLGPLPKIQ